MGSTLIIVPNKVEEVCAKKNMYEELKLSHEEKSKASKKTVEKGSTGNIA